VPDSKGEAFCKLAEDDTAVHRVVKGSSEQFEIGFRILRPDA
jgi:hypothetical protein